MNFSKQRTLVVIVSGISRDEHCFLRKAPRRIYAALQVSYVQKWTRWIPYRVSIKRNKKYNEKIANIPCFRFLGCFIASLVYLSTTDFLTPYPISIRRYISLSGFLWSFIQPLVVVRLGSKKRPSREFPSLGKLLLTKTTAKLSVQVSLGGILIILRGSWMQVIPRFLSSMPFANPIVGPMIRTWIESLPFFAFKVLKYCSGQKPQPCVMWSYALEYKWCWSGAYGTNARRVD